VSLNPKEDCEQQDSDPDQQGFLSDDEAGDDDMQHDQDLEMLESTGMIKVEKLYYNIIRKTKFSCG